MSDGELPETNVAASMVPVTIYERQFLAPHVEKGYPLFQSAIQLLCCNICAARDSVGTPRLMRTNASKKRARDRF